MTTPQRLLIGYMDSFGQTDTASRPIEHADRVTWQAVTRITFKGRVYECEKWKQHGGECLDMETLEVVILEVE